MWKPTAFLLLGAILVLFPESASAQSCMTCREWTDFGQHECGLHVSVAFYECTAHSANGTCGENHTAAGCFQTFQMQKALFAQLSTSIAPQQLSRLIEVALVEAAPMIEYRVADRVLLLRGCDGTVVEEAVLSEESAFVVFDAIRVHSEEGPQARPQT